jgi:GT2 family glycosyltransferase
VDTTTDDVRDAGPARARADVAAVVLTRGDRIEDLDVAVASVVAQHDVRVSVVVVWNGVPIAPAAPAAARHVRLADNVGIPAGRNAGAAHTAAPLVLFLDDDARLLGDGLLAAAVERFHREDRLAVVCPRIVDDEGRTAQRHVPRLGRRGAARPGPVTTFLGGVSVVRREAFDEVGGFEGELFYSMEETDLAWRLIDRGWSIFYDPDLRVAHPKTDPSRHAASLWRTARNRVWIAHRLLPVPLAVTYLATWLAIGAIRSPSAVGVLLAGYRNGWRTRIGPRRPIRWRTVARLARLGRPPVV